MSASSVSLPRHRRSCLSVPGASERMLGKAPSFAADMVLFDLEDSVPPAQRNDRTRVRVAHALNASGWRPRTRAVRVNSPSTQWCEADVSVVVETAGEHLDCIVIPKLETPDEVLAIDRLLTDLETAFGLERRIGIEAQIESARGLVEVERIAASSSRLETLVFGPGDYAASLTVPQFAIGAVDKEYPGDQWHYPRSRIAVAAHAFGLQPIDGPFASIDDLAGLRESARWARLLGFQGKWVIHPVQVGPCNEIFTPTEAELEQARRLLEKLQQEQTEGRGAGVLDGVMIDEAARRAAEAILTRAEALTGGGS